MVPHSVSGFDVSRHSARDDNILNIFDIFSSNGQTPSSLGIKYTQLPTLPWSRLCPVTALKQMLSRVPGSQDDPLFYICPQSRWFPLTGLGT